MKRRFVLDAWAMLALLQMEEPAASRVKMLLEEGEAGNIKLFVSIINFGEVVYRVGKVQPRALLGRGRVGTPPPPAGEAGRGLCRPG